MDLDGVYFPSFNGFETDNFVNTSGVHFISSQNEPGSSFTPNPSGDGCGLLLGLGPTPISCSNNEQTKLSSSSLLNDSYPNLKPGLSGETRRFSFGCLESPSTQSSARPAIPVFDEGSTSAKNSGGYMPSLLLPPRTFETEQVPPFMSNISDFPTNPSCNKSQLFFEPSTNMDYSTTTSTLSGSSVVTSVKNNTRPHHILKRCSFTGCTKPPRGKSGLCIRHGGGKRCTVEGCTRSAEGQPGLCISHGGGKRCTFLGCTKGAQGSTMFCKAHGGGKRCTFLGCTKGAEGRTPLCKAHGGGRRCMFDGGGICPKSVHGGTDFCVAHGGGKRCGALGCTKSARGRTDRCVRHGGGKRCRVEGCGKSAQGSTELCKAHGGGKRCNWGGERCEKFARGKSGLCAAHNNMAQGGTHKKPPQTLISRDLFHGLVSGRNLSSGDSVVSDCGGDSSVGTSAKQEPLIPVDFLVPLSMKFSGSQTAEKEQDVDSLGVVVPEGRVHGGSLLSLLGGNLSNAMHEL